MMKKILRLTILFFAVEAFFAQTIYAQAKQISYPEVIKLPTINSSSYGVCFGLQQGLYTNLEIGMERYWQQIKLTNPRTTVAGLMADVNIKHGVGGLKTHIWTRKGRLGLTLGGAAGVYSNFSNESSFAFGPTVGYRLLGLHAHLGFNFMLGDSKMEGVNKLYGGLRYYIPMKTDISIKKGK